nr:MAG TPA: hypothetical protein [Caudoviricetes sp.]
MNLAEGSRILKTPYFNFSAAIFQRVRFSPLYITLI